MPTDINGEELVERIEEAARERGLSPYLLTKRFAPHNPTAWLETMRATHRPRPQTVRRVWQAIEEAA